MTHDKAGIGFNDAALSITCGLALLLAVRFAYALTVGHVPDALLLSGTDPIARLSLARLLLFAVIALPLSLLLSWPLAHHAKRREIVIAIPGASCAAALFVLLEHWQQFDPFPAWFSVARALVLFAVLPAALLAWWRWTR